MPMDTQTLNPDEQMPVDPTLETGMPPEVEDYGEWNESLPKELQDALIRLADKYCDEFKYPRRLEVMQAWKARSFWRELQHLSWNWDKDCWDVLGPAGNDKSTITGTDSAVLYTTNIYQGFGESFIAIVTQAVPNLRFEPEDPEDAADIETAAAGENIRKMIQHENDPIKLMTKAAFYAWTDGRIHGRTSWEKDSRTGQPRETQKVYGSMEVKVPIIYDEQSEYNYLQFSEESHLSTVRAMVKGRAFPDEDQWKKIKGGSSKTGQDTWERIARISVKQGVSIKSAGGDTYAYLCTIQRTWMRPSTFMEESETMTDDIRTQLETVFPTGAILETANGVYIGSKDGNMDDEWAVKNIMEGDGAFRNAKGTCVISVQERANDIINATQDTYEKCQPASHWDDKLFDMEAMGQQQSRPGTRYGYDADSIPEGDNPGNHVFFEPAAQVSADMLSFLQSLMTDCPQFLTGISPILWGQTGSTDQSGKALSIQQAAAMGRMGLPYRVMKQFYAQMMEQAIRCASRNRKEDARMGIPDEHGEIQTVSVRIEDLQGQIRCFPDLDESYPESWMSKRGTYMSLMQEGNADPTMHAILSNPQNQAFGKKMIGLQELVLPDANSWNKQMTEINFMMTEPPTEQPQQMPNPLTGDIETINVPQSSVPIDADYDNHEAEFVTVCNFLNSPKGQRLKRENQASYENIRLHGLLHRAEIIKKMAASAMEDKTSAPPPGHAKPKGKGQASPPKDQPEGGQGKSPFAGPAPA